MWDFSIRLAAGSLFTQENESRAWSQLSAGQVFGKIWVLAKSAVAIHVNYIYSGFTPVDGVYIFIYKISKIVHTLWLAKRSVCVRVCKHSCDVKMFCFSRANHASTNLKKFLSSKLDEFTLFTHSFVGWNLENLYKQAVSILFSLKVIFLSEKNPYFWKHLFAKQGLITRESLRVHDFATGKNFSFNQFHNKEFCVFLGKVFFIKAIENFFPVFA